MIRVSAIFMLLATAALGLVEPPLPAWEDENREDMIEGGWIAGGSLLGFGPLPDEEIAAETPLDDVGPAPDALTEEESDENIVSEEYLTEYFAEKPPGFLVDPQGLMPETERKDLEAFLDYHSGDASIDMFIYVFGGGQEIPSDVREEEVVERLYSVGRPAVVVYYYLGSPQRSTTYLSPIITDAVSAAEQRRALQSSVMRAFESTEPFEQLEAFLVQMSIRIYWMERMTEGTAIETMEEIPGGAAARSFTRKAELDVVADTPLPPWVKISAGAAASAVGFLLFVWSGFMWFRARARYVFPEFDVEPRLGGSHAAGIGAVISFSSSSVPPASQRAQVPDYMRRA